MQSVIDGLSAGVQVYLVGGAIRNALVKKYHGEEWVQRDYDQAIVAGSADYLQYLESLGFTYGGIDDSEHKTMAKPVVENGRPISYEDNVVFDMHLVDGTTIEDNLLYSTGLSINGFALDLTHVFDDDWESKLITLPGALDSIKGKQININPYGYKSDSNYFFALIRFVSKGFAAPALADVLALLKGTAYLSAERYKRNVTKLVGYLGSEQRVREVVDSLGIDGLDIFDEQKTRELIARL